MTKYQQYVEYKDSGVEWLGKVPTHWNIKRIKETAQIINGYPFDSEKFDPINGTPLVRIRDINSNETQVFFNGSVPKEALIFNSDILIGMDGDFNVSQWKGGEAALNQRVCCLRSNDTFLTKFLSYLLPTRMKIINDLTYFTTVKHLSSTDILKTVYAIPNKIEYANIANFLDHETAKIDSLIEKQQQLIQLLKEKRQAVISHAVTKGLNPNVPMKDSGVEWLGQVPEHWDTAPLKHLCELLKDGTHLPPPRVDSGIPLLSVRNIINNKFTFRDDDSQISESSYADLCKSFIPKNGDVVLAIVGATIGKVALIEKMENFHIQRSLGIFRTRKTKLNNYFLAYIFGSKGFQSLLWENAGFSAQPGIYLGALSNFLIPVPSIEEQKSIIDFIEIQLVNFDNLINKALHSVQLMQERRTVLISAAVTGKIDVRNWQNPTEAKMEFSA